MIWNGDCKTEGCERETVDSSGYCKKHKPMADEWTAELLKRYDLSRPEAAQALARRINAALESAKRESAKEIAAEREQWQLAVEDCHLIISRKNEQLAAERERTDEKVKRLESLTNQAIELKKQLAAERENKPVIDRILDLANQLDRTIRERDCANDDYHALQKEQDKLQKQLAVAVEAMEKSGLHLFDATLAQIGAK